ncbi:MAG: hypothetical protein LCH26_02850 [Proteobacteria bacterium]|nr:hypothetical protein [Pseudomonadota bacterium]
MSMDTKSTRAWLEAHPKCKQWLWFVGLWCGGLMTITAMAYPVKWLIHSIG